MANEENKPKIGADEISDEDLKQVTGGISAIKPIGNTQVNEPIEATRVGDSASPSGWDLKANKDV